MFVVEVGVGGMNTHAKCWQTAVDLPRPSLFSDACSKVMLLLSQNASSETRAQFRGHLRPPQRSPTFYPLFFTFTFPPSFLFSLPTTPLIFKALRLREHPRRPALSINIQWGPEVRNRRGKAEKNSATIMDFSSPFHSLLVGEMRREAPPAHNERSGEGIGTWGGCREEEEMMGEISDEAKRRGRRSR